MYLKLIRERPEGLAVRGTLYLATYDTFAEEEVLTKLCSTLENRDYLIPPLIYRLTVTYSPKFKRPLPLVNSVPRTPPTPLWGEEYRTGIRFHPGTKPEHSRGCILVSRKDEDMLRELILSEQEVRLEINQLHKEQRPLR